MINTRQVITPKTILTIIPDIKITTIQCTKFINALKNNNLHIATDGSSSTHNSAAAMVSYDNQTIITHTMSMKFPHIQDNMASIYPETSVAIMSIKFLLYLETMLKDHEKINSPSYKIKIYIDNQEVINRIQNKHKLHHNLKFYPISKALQHFISKITFNIDWIWIKSHTQTTTITGNLNDIADKLAQQCRKSTRTTPKWPNLQNDDGIVLYDDLPIMDNKNIKRHTPLINYSPISQTNGIYLKNSCASSTGILLP